MRLRLPKVGRPLCTGDVKYAAFRTIVDHTALITDPDVLASIDTSLAARTARWPSAATLRCKDTCWIRPDKQLPDSTVIWTAPAGHTYVTTPGSALLFPTPGIPTGDSAPPEPKDAAAAPTGLLPSPNGGAPGPKTAPATSNPNAGAIGRHVKR